jgi:hypothetical protein
MKKTYRFILTLAILGAVSNLAFADGNAFTPLNFDDASSVPQATPAVQNTSSNPVSNAFLKVFPSKDVAANTSSNEVPVGNDNIQNAILELDNAQVGIRNDLLEYKAKYADVDAQYKLVKNERSMLQKQIKSIEKRIKNIDKAKEKIRKNML